MVDQRDGHNLLTTAKTEEEAGMDTDVVRIEEQDLTKPLDDRQRQSVDKFFTVNRIYTKVLKEIQESLPIPLTNYQKEHLFYHDVTDVAYFRTNFFETIGTFLESTVAIKYQLAFQGRDSHSKRTFTLQELNQVSPSMVIHGNLVETMSYPTFGIKIRRYYVVQNHHLYFEKSQFLVENQEIAWTDGLMRLQKHLEGNSFWLRNNWLSVKAYT